MSPAVVFAPLAAKTHSVVLTSGTLSPLESFAGELGVAFPTRLEANHVIDMRRQVRPAVAAPHLLTCVCDVLSAQDMYIYVDIFIMYERIRYSCTERSAYTDV